MHFVGIPGGAMQAALASMDQHGVRRAVLLPPPQAVPMFDYDGLREAARAHPGRFSFLGGGGSLNPLIHGNRDPATVTGDLKRRFTEDAERIVAAGAAGFGEIAAFHPSFMPGHPYEEVPPDHPLLLLLADIAARHAVVIDLHMDLVVEPAPPRGPHLRGDNPAVFPANIEGFERLLAHNRAATFVWAHAGSDPVGHWTVARSRELLRRHPNLHMSLRLGGGLPPNRPLDEADRLRPEWLELFREFPDRFVIGNDTFFVGEGVPSRAPPVAFAAFNDAKLRRAASLLAQLPPEIAARVGHGNAARLYKLKD